MLTMSRCSHAGCQRLVSPIHPTLRADCNAASRDVSPLEHERRALTNRPLGRTIPCRIPHRRNTSHGHCRKPRLSSNRRPARVETGGRGVLGGQPRPRGTSGHGRGPPPAALAVAAVAGHRAHPLERLLALRPRARHGGHGRGRAEAVRLVGRNGRPGDLLRHGPGHRRNPAPGHDQVVRHELPLPRARVRAGHEVQARLDQARRPVPGGGWRWASTPGRCCSGR